MRVMNKSMITVLPILLAVPLFAQEFSYARNRDDAELDKSIRSGNAESMSEARRRGKPIHKASLEWVADHYEEHVTPSYRKYKGKNGSDVSELLNPEGYANAQRQAKEIERITRNAAKVELAQWGEEKYFDEFVAELSTSGLRIQYDAIDKLVEIDNMAALKHLAKLLDNSSVLPRSGDVIHHSIGVSAAGAMSRIVGSNLGTRRLVWGVDYQGYEEFRAYWKNWWRDNKSKYGDLSFASQVKKAVPPVPAQSAQGKILRQTERLQAIPIGSESGSATARLDTVQLELPNPRGKMETVDVVMALSDDRGSLWWVAVQADGSAVTDKAQAFLAAHKLYLLNGKIVSFTTKGTALVISEQSDQAFTFDEALKKILSKIQETPDGKEWLPQAEKTVDLWRIFGREFLPIAPGVKFVAPSLEGIAHKDSQWLIQLQNKGNDKATVTTSDDYKAVSATVNGQAIYPK